MSTSTLNLNPDSVMVLRDIVVAAQAGDNDAFTTLVKGHANLVCTVALAVVRDVAASEEVAQDVFVHAWRGLSGLRNPESFRPWLRQMTRQRAADFVRKQARRRRVEHEADGPDAAPSALDRLQNRERVQAVIDALDALPVEHREVLALYYREDRTVLQVADLLELKAPTVRKRLSRARALLREDVQRRLEDSLVHTRPNAAFVAGVCTAVSMAAPSTAVAATAGAGAVKAVATGALVGTSVGLGAVAIGYAAARRRITDAAGRRALLRYALGHVVAILVAVAFITGVRGPIGAVLGLLTMLGAGWGLFFGLTRAYASRQGAPSDDPEAQAYVRRNQLGGLTGLVLGSVSAVGATLYGMAKHGTIDALVTAVAVQAVAFVLIPLILAFWVPPFLCVPRRTVLVGALTWLFAAPFLFAVPAATVAVIKHPLAGAVALAVTAGLAEELSRWMVYRRLPGLRGPAGCAHAIVLGIGHGGVEAVLFGLPAVAGFVMLLTMPEAIPAGAIGTPGAHVSLAVSRIGLLSVHVALTLLVWRSVVRASVVWLAIAIAVHIGIDLAAFALPVIWPSHGLMIGGSVVAATIVAAVLWTVAESRRARII